VILPQGQAVVSEHLFSIARLIMTLTFPNPSRSFDATRDAVRFWGYDSAIECSFFVTRDALERLVPRLLPEETALLAAFDRNRELICRAATRVYSRGQRGSYELDASAF
jgi:hypothetical protein